MDREHLATVVGRLRSWCDPARLPLVMRMKTLSGAVIMHGASANLRADLIDAADAIEALVSEVDRLRSGRSAAAGAIEYLVVEVDRLRSALDASAAKIMLMWAFAADHGDGE